MLEQRLYLTGFRAQHLGQHLRRVAVPGQRRLQVIDLFGQYGVDDGLADRFLAGLVSGLECERQMLFDLDRSIIEMAQNTPTNPTVLRLTALYHNLVRKWGEPT